MADDVCFALLRNTIYQILHSAGFESSHGEPANVLADIFGQYIQLLASSASTYAQLAGRTVACPWDIADGLVDVQVTLDQLQDWLESEQGQFLVPAWSTKADPNNVLKDVVTNGQVHHEVSQILYEYCAADQHYCQANHGKLDYTNGDDVAGTVIPSASSTVQQNDGQQIRPLPDYVPHHLPSFPSSDLDGTVNQSNYTPHQSNKKPDHTTMQPEYSTTAVLSSLLPSTDHNSRRPSPSAPPIPLPTLPSKKTPNDNPFIHVVPFDDSSLASGNSLSLTLPSSTTYAKSSSSLQQPHLDLDERNEMELAKKQRRAEINGTMEATINTIMEQYRQQQKQLGTDGNQLMFQHITQNEAAPGKTSLGTRDSILDEMVYRLAPPVALARLSSPNLLLDTAIAPTPRPENPTLNSDTAGQGAPFDGKGTATRSTEPSPPSSSTSQQSAPPSPPPAKKATATLIPTPDAMTQPPIALTSSSSSSTVHSSHRGWASSSSAATHRPPSNNASSFGAPPIPTSSQPPAKIPMSIAKLSAGGGTNSIKKDKSGLSVKASNEAKNGTTLPKKKKRPRSSMDMGNINTKRPAHIPPTPLSPLTAIPVSKQWHEQPVVSSTINLPPTKPTNKVESTPTPLKKKRKKKNDSNELGQQRSAPDTPLKVRFKEQVDISNSSFEHGYWSSPSPSLHHTTQPTLSTKPTPSSSAAAPLPLTSITATTSSPMSFSSSSAAPTSSVSSSYPPATDHLKKKKKKKYDYQQIKSSHSSLAVGSNNGNNNNSNSNNRTKNSLVPDRVPPTNVLSKMASGDSTPLHHAKKQVAPIPTRPSASSSSTVVTRTPVAPAAMAPHSLFATPATNMYYDTAETVRCICENPTVDYGTFMISCDKCLVWFHGSCVWIAEHDQVDYWICSRCQ